VNDSLDRARALAALGLRLFPCRADKRPYTAHGVLDATTDPATIKHWWAAHPDALVGVATGASGLVVADVDSHGTKNGAASLKAAGLSLPASYHYRSLSGNGLHVVYAAPEGAPLGPTQDHPTPDGITLVGVDRRAGASYVVWAGPPPSSRAEFREPPGWLLTPTGAMPRVTGAKPDDVAAWINDHTNDAEADSPDAVALVDTVAGRDFTATEMLKLQMKLFRIDRHGGVVRQSLQRLYREWTRPPWNTGEHQTRFLDGLAGAIARIHGDKVPEGQAHGTRTALEGPRRLVLTKASEIDLRRQLWLWSDRIPQNVVTVFAGMGGVGKSSYSLHVAARATKGTLPGEYVGTPVPVIVISHEDDWATQVGPRLTAAGADLDLVHKLSVAMTWDEDAGEHVPTLPFDIPLIRQAVDQTGARLVIIDPLSSVTPGNTDKTADVRAALDPLNKFAADTGVSVIGLLHFNKGAGTVSHKVSGSHAFRDVARSVLAFAEDPETGEVVVSPDKGNYSSERRSFAFRLTTRQVTTLDGPTTVPVVVDLGATKRTVSELINRGPERVPDDEQSEALAFLVDYLRSAPGRAAPASEILREAKEARFTEGTVKNARTRSREPHIGTRKRGMGGGWVWTLDVLPDADDQGESDTPDGGTPEGVSSEGIQKVSSSRWRDLQGMSETFSVCHEPQTPWKVSAPPEGVSSVNLTPSDTFRNRPDAPDTGQEQPRRLTLGELRERTRKGA
jgi:hypothetical protein